MRAKHQRNERATFTVLNRVLTIKLTIKCGVWPSNQTNQTTEPSSSSLHTISKSISLLRINPMDNRGQTWLFDRWVNGQNTDTHTFASKRVNVWNGQHCCIVEWHMTTKKNMKMMMFSGCLYTRTKPGLLTYWFNSLLCFDSIRRDYLSLCRQFDEYFSSQRHYLAGSLR